MSDFTLMRESCTEILDYSVLISEFENGDEQRRLVHSYPLLGFKIKSPVLTKARYGTYRAFFVQKYGASNSFTFTSPFDDVEYTVRFEPGSFKASFGDGVYQCEFEFKVVR